jgi:hypothetical protein
MEDHYPGMTTPQRHERDPTRFDIPGVIAVCVALAVIAVVSSRS